MSARRKWVISTDGIQFNHKSTQTLSAQKRETAEMAKRQK